ncbi:hypothetical protein [Salinicoccus kekensis]|uniref:DUF1659 domain-containing protein n=1 Tax=Salinicoccus kekensis TaxID=714307 RepID=A0A285U8U8_9STAP|nr:hypothetical protein [Salinicoccus kekensis]SOC38163.1 hypothetical protein SAMN05878391_0320 [Salinicoccus kekensis]
MHKSTSARFYYLTTDSAGKEILRYRTVPNIDIQAGNDAINQLKDVYEALTNDVYAIVEKEETYVIG